MHQDDDETELVNCPECDELIDPTGDSCPNCGVTFVDDHDEMAPCPGCAKLLDLDALECPHCGMEFE